MKKKSGVIKLITSLVFGLLAGGCISSYFKNRIIQQENKKISKFKNYYYLLNKWLSLKNEGIDIKTYFTQNNIKTIAIYGMGELGDRLYEELLKSNITVKYGIDKNAGSTFSELEVYDLDSELPEVDAIVVTAVFAFDDIKEELNNRVDYPVISLESVIFEF